MSCSVFVDVKVTGTRSKTSMTEKTQPNQQPSPGLQPRTLANGQWSNWEGLKTLYLREVRRFVKVYTQTLVAPVVTSLLFLAVFTLALGGDGRLVAGLPFAEFLAPGLVMVAVVQNAFANSSSSVMISKIQGNIVDSLMPPLSPQELVFGFTIGSATRGLMVALLVTLAMMAFVDMSVHSIFFLLFHATMASLMLSLVGLMGALWSEKFDHIAAVTNFVVTPLSFLSGTFYSITRLPETVQVAAHLNPFFYMIDGFRYGFTGHADGNLTAGLIMMAATNVVLWVLAVHLFKIGYKLKA